MGRKRTIAKKREKRRKITNKKESDNHEKGREDNNEAREREIKRGR